MKIGRRSHADKATTHMIAVHELGHIYVSNYFGYKPVAAHLLRDGRGVAFYRANGNWSALSDICIAMGGYIAVNGSATLKQFFLAPGNYMDAFFVHKLRQCNRNMTNDMVRACLYTTRSILSQPGVRERLERDADHLCNRRVIHFDRYRLPTIVVGTDNTKPMEKKI